MNLAMRRRMRINRHAAHRIDHAARYCGALMVMAVIMSRVVVALARVAMNGVMIV